MDWLTNEVMLYGGGAVFVGTAAVAAIYSVILRIQWLRMNKQMDEEYGKRESDRGVR